MLEQAVAQVVDHPLPGVDLHLRAVGRDELVDELQHHAGDDELTRRHERISQGGDVPRVSRGDASGSDLPTSSSR